jgi:hypothetical protein
MKRVGFCVKAAAAEASPELRAGENQPKKRDASMPAQVTLFLPK